MNPMKKAVVVRIDPNGDGWFELRIDGLHYDFFRIEDGRVIWASALEAEQMGEGQ